MTLVSVALPRSRAPAQCASLVRGSDAAPAFGELPTTAVPPPSAVRAVPDGRSTPAATARPPLETAKRIEPFGSGSCSRVSVSPGWTGFRNLAAPTVQRTPEPPRACSARRTVSSSNTTPGSTGDPGKWPASAGWRASIVKEVVAPMSDCVSGFRLRSCKGAQGFLRELAGAGARQTRHQQQRARQEHRIDAPAELRGDRRGVEPRRDHAGAHPGHGCIVTGGVTVKEGAIEHAGDGVELMVEVGEGAALAGDVDEICQAAMQQEATPAEHLDDVAHARGLLHVAAMHPGLALAR